MQAWARRGTRFLRDEGGPTASEYAVMLGLVVMVVMVGVTLLGTKVNDVFAYFDTNLSDGIPAT